MLARFCAMMHDRKYRRYVKFRTPQSWTNIYPVHLEINAVHWGEAPWTADGFHEDGSLRYRGVQHDEAPRPSYWRWWRLCSLSLVDCSPRDNPTTHSRVWIYTRWGSLFIDLTIDRREAA